SYGELHERIIRASGLLHDLGVRKGDRVAILAENSPEWVIVYFAIVRLGGIAVPMLPDFLDTDVHHILRDTAAPILFATSRQLVKVQEFADRTLKKVITLDEVGRGDAGRRETEPFSRLFAKSPRFALRTQDSIKKAADRVLADDTASIIYTSGTSGHSKAVMLTHRNLISNALAATSLAEIAPEWVFLSLLPLSHTYEFTINCLVPLLHGCRIVYAGKPPTPSTLERICQAEHPTAICLVPMVLEKIYKKKILPLIGGNRLFRMAVNLPGLGTAIYRQLGKRFIRFLGGRIRLVAIGGAPLNLEVEKFLARAGVPYAVGYGLTEASPLLSGGPVNDPTIAIGSAGKPIPGVEIKIVTPTPDSAIGEIHARGDNIMLGYYRNPEATRAIIDDDGWLATGDLGYLDRANNLVITGRSKNVIVLSHGENIYPESVEDKINSLPHIVESLVLADNDRLEAWVYLDYDLIDRETAGGRQQQKRQYIDELLQKTRATVNQQLPAYGRIARFVEQPEPFVKTATHKIKRYLYQSNR
ncbi:MAG: AMP-binding protein, partial [Desulfobulbaceae bacterium]|nr:AMP-binding protein [Desulfobulbaceae bacterium]